MATTITDFYPGTTKSFTVTCKINGVAQDITGDTVTFRIKKNYSPVVADAAAVLTKTADVTTDGANGNAIFTLLPADTKSISAGDHYCDVEWVTAGGAEYVVYNAPIKLLRRISDPPA